MLLHLASHLAGKSQSKTQRQPAHPVCPGCRPRVYLLDTERKESVSICIPSIRSVMIVVALVGVG
jgi:hypothetical protein